MKATHDTIDRKVSEVQDDIKEVELSQQDIEKRLNQEVSLATEKLQDKQFKDRREWSEKLDDILNSLKSME